MELTREFFVRNGFTSMYPEGTAGYQTAFYLRGGDSGEGWKVVVDLMLPKASYVRNTPANREYDGPIKTIEELKLALILCQIPLKIKTEE